jgi:hypothetical protein
VGRVDCITSQEHNRPTSGIRVWKSRKLKSTMTLGRDNGMEVVGIFSLCGLVGIFGYWDLGAKDVHAWVEDN